MEANTSCTSTRVTLPNQSLQWTLWLSGLDNVTTNTSTAHQIPIIHHHDQRVNHFTWINHTMSHSMNPSEWYFTPQVLMTSHDKIQYNDAYNNQVEARLGSGSGPSSGVGLSSGVGRRQIWRSKMAAVQTWRRWKIYSHNRDLLRFRREITRFCWMDAFLSCSTSFHRPCGRCEASVGAKMSLASVLLFLLSQHVYIIYLIVHPPYRRLGNISLVYKVAECC